MIGQKLAIGSNTGNIRIITVLDQIVKEGLLYYTIRDEVTSKCSEAEAKQFEATFKVTHGAVRPRHYKGAGPTRRKRGKRK